MNLFDSPEEAKFRAEAKAWLEQAVPAFHASHVDRSEGAMEERAKAWQRQKFEAGFAGLHIPAAYGGGGLSFVEELIFRHEQAQFDTPRGPFIIGTGMTIPVLLAYADEAAKVSLIPKILSGEEIWCQLFSEPGAGSDLAAIRTRAVRDGDNWCVTGQKVWNTYAHLASRGILLTRTDPTLPKHKGLTFFHVDMKSPGIKVNPIRMVNGVAEFNETFLDEVMVPDTNRLGAEGDGWRVSLTTLKYERFEISEFPGPTTIDAFRLAMKTPTANGSAIDDGLVQERLARWYTESAGIKYMQLRALTVLSRGGEPGPETSVGKLIGARKMQELCAFAMEMQSHSGLIVDATATGFQSGWLWSPGGRVAGGTDEIIRNVIAERVLGLPQDARADTDVPFAQL
jgi:alkylation response protein AidB-like acyl-CoA dehydrogenase